MTDEGRRTTFASLLRAHRRAANLSQEELAERAGLSVPAIGLLERGARRAPRTTTIESLVAALELDSAQRQEMIRAARAAPQMANDLAVVTVPRELPRRPTDFTGRDAELVTLLDALDPDGRSYRICAIDGMGGVGKSALALHAAHLLIARGAYPDGQLYVNLRGSAPGQPLTPLEALGRLLRSLGMDPDAVPDDVDEAAARLRTAAAGQRVLILLDNARSVEHVLPLLPGSDTCAVLVTSRQSMATLEGVLTLHLDILQPAAARELLGRIVGRRRAAADPQAASDMTRVCGGLPLAIRIAGARLAARPNRPMRHLVAQLGDATRRLEVLQAGQFAVRACFDVSLDALEASDDPLDRAASAVFGLLALPDGSDLEVEAAARLLDRTPEATRRVLERLVDARLLESPHPDRYEFHDLVRLHARERALEQVPEPDRLAAFDRLMSFYTATAWRTLALVRPGDRRLTNADSRWTPGGLTFSDSQAALSWAESERANLLAAVTQAATLVSSGIAAELPGQLASAMFGFFVARGYLHDWLQVNTVALDVARRTGNRLDEASAQTNLGAACELLGRYGQAIAFHRESLAIFRELGDRDGEAGAMNNLGCVWGRLEKHRQAIPHLEQSLAIFRELGTLRGQASSLCNLGDAYGRTGRCGEAIAALEESLAIWRRLDARMAEAHTLNELGVVHGMLGSHERAIACLLESLDLYRAIGASMGQAECLRELGAIYARAGRADAAVRCLQNSLAIVRELDANGNEVLVLRDLGDALEVGGFMEEARLAWQEGLEIADELHLPAAAEIRGRLE